MIDVVQADAEIVLDFDDRGRLLGVEILGASVVLPDHLLGAAD